MAPAPGKKREMLEIGGREVADTNPDKIYFPRAGHTKLDLVRYYLQVAEGALRAVAGRPMLLRRYVEGAEGEAFFQKRAPKSRPAWIETATFRFPSGREADEIVVRDAAQLVWVVNKGCIDLNPHPVRSADLDHPDELRVDLDPGPGVSWDDVRRVALLVGEVLEEHGLLGCPKTSGSRGFHVYASLHPRWEFGDVRRAALALAPSRSRNTSVRKPSHFGSKSQRSSAGMLGTSLASIGLTGGATGSSMPRLEEPEDRGRQGAGGGEEEVPGPARSLLVGREPLEGHRRALPMPQRSGDVQPLAPGGFERSCQSCHHNPRVAKAEQ